MFSCYSGFCPCFKVKLSLHIIPRLFTLFRTGQWPLDISQWLFSIYLYDISQMSSDFSAQSMLCLSFLLPHMHLHPFQKLTVHLFPPCQRPESSLNVPIWSQLQPVQMKGRLEETDQFRRLSVLMLEHVGVLGGTCAALCGKTYHEYTASHPKHFTVTVWKWHVNFYFYIVHFRC